MHIKQITISNFRSFRQQPEIYPFSSTTNCVVGRNGSGKSNLFDAVQFVLLSPRFATLRSEERQALLHEGSGSAAVNAFVEVVFDNSDHRFSLEHSDEVVLRRTVGLKKDEFFLQRKRATKQEVQSLLEGAGFSKSNPYFMVQQGKIQTLCLMTDTQRLQLLQQVAGTTLYEDKKAESLVKMQENAQSIDKINSILEDIHQRLAELKGETEELTLYQSCDRTRKALEYTLYDKELYKARHVLDHLEHERLEHLEQLAQLHEAAKNSHNHIQNAEGKLKWKTEALKRNRIQLQHAEQDKTKGVTLQTKLDLQCQELQEQVQLGEERLQLTQVELKRLEKQISSAQDERKTVDAEWKSQQGKLQDLLRQKDQTLLQVDGLYAKQGRGKEYSSKEERDRSLKKQIKKLQKVEQDKNATLTKQQDVLGHLRRSSTEQEISIQTKQEDLRSKKESLQLMHKALEDKQKNHHAAMEVRKQTWRQAEDLQERSKHAREAVQKCLSEVRKSMPRATAHGLKALNHIVEQERLVRGKQYFGMVMENMKLKDPKYQTAVEVAAQNSLFHVIVDSDDTAAKLMKRLEDGKLGRVTFMPLNRLRIDSSTRYPQSTDVVPLLETCIDFKPEVGRAMQHVFDKKVLARSTEVAAEWASKVHMDCITLDGDLCSRKGALTGGYVDHNRSRLRAFHAQTEAESDFRKVDQEFRQMDRKAKEAEQDVTNVSQEVERLQRKQSQLSQLLQNVESELKEKRSQLGDQKKHAERLESQILPPLEREIAAVSGDIARLQEEIGTDLQSTLTDEDLTLLAQLKDDMKSLQGKIFGQTEAVEELQANRQRVESLLENNLLKRLQELTQVYKEDEGGLMATSTTMLQEQKQRELVDRRQQLQQASKDVVEIDRTLDELRQVDEELKLELNSVKNELEKLKSQDMKNSKLLGEASERSEKLMGKKSMNIGKRENYMRKIQELGSLPPPSELEKYKGKSIQSLEKELDRVNKKLKKYSHVNKKAFDQYVNFSEQRESLIKRKAELDKGAEKVKELVESLDRKKDEAINRTFRGVSRHFAEVFQELVPLGAGELIMRTALDEAEENDTDPEMDSETDSPAKKQKFDAANPDVSLYRGIGIKVRFSAVGENFIMSQLSGGQKALVALALIFAIQRCDPAPFYIFDELDQALDSSYRQAVANVIHRQANNPDSPTQFITSTFRPELVAISKNCYGISHQNKVSSIHHMSKNDALRFIASLMSEEEAVGEVSAVRSKKTRRDSRKRKSSDEEETNQESAAEGETAQTTLPTTVET